jgi:hypothetical protein
MAKRGSDKKEPRRPLRDIITEVLGNSPSLSTAQIRKRAGKLSGKSFSANGVYLALRAMVKSGSLSSRRDGHKRIFSLANSRPARIASTPEPAEAPAPMAAVAEAAHTHPRATPARPLAMGEIAIVHVGDETLVSATNVHGELVLKRHRVPRN